MDCASGFDTGCFVDILVLRTVQHQACDAFICASRHSQVFVELNSYGSTYHDEWASYGYPRYLFSTHPFLPLHFTTLKSHLTRIVIFAGLEWGHFPNFEAASLTQSSVAIILPLGTLAAQQITKNGSLAYISNGSNKSGNSYSNGEKSSPSFTRPNFSGVSTTCGSGNRHQSSCGTGEPRARKLDHFDLELRQIDSTSALADDHVRVDTDLEQKETRI